ncbi:methyltransferase domain-containing protein [Streptomyces sp. NPDC021020]|uniref:methyltransferase domain-containing protein n=1 Tax=Streptomyces sp. NPDC021020 TaxID=3365109 RepID=UPI0037ADDD6B
MTPAVIAEQRVLQHETMEQRRLWPARSPWLGAAVNALPREDFAPDRVWRWDGHAYVPVDRATEPRGWAGEVYGDPFAAAVTQVRGGLATSSLSCTAVVVDMLDSLLLEPGQRVLELGTGTGWNAALLAWRAGSSRVVTIEVDAGLAEQARSRLRAAGTAVDVHVADGADGWPDGGPYDRVIATYAVDSVPWAWVAGTRPGGRIVAPWGRLGHVALTVADNGQYAQGWFQGLAQFMPARGTGTPDRTFAQVRGGAPAQDERVVTRELSPLRDSQHLLFALRVALPQVRITTGTDQDGVNAWLHDGLSSWAALSAAGTGRTIAYQAGPRRLADEVENAWDTWERAGSPTVYDFGMTVTARGQVVWANDPVTGPRWPATTAPPHRQPAAHASPTACTGAET